MIRKLRALATLGAGIGLALGLSLAVLAAPALATDNTIGCGTWKIQGATGTYPNIEFGAKPEGSSFTNHEAVLTKAEDDTTEDAGLPGVEFAAYDLDAEVDGPTTVTVEFEASEEGASASGAIRLFGYDAQGADTINDGPDYSATAEADSGTLSMIIPAGGRLGTLGMTYDGSNAVQGSVTFSNLKIGDLLVSFKACPEPEQTASPKPTLSPLPDPTTGPTRGPVKATPSASMLPVTGEGGGTNWPAVIGGVGGLIVVAGIAAVYFTRRRTFEA